MNNTVNERVANVIEELGLTANSFATKLGVAGSVIYNIVRNKTKPSYELMEKMVSLFNINPSYLINGTGEVLTKPIIETDDMFDSETNRLIYLSDNSMQLDQPLIEKLIRADGSKKMANEYTEIEGNTYMINCYLSNYSSEMYMIDIAKEYRLGKITVNEFKLKFKKRIELQKELYEKIKPFAKTVNEMYNVISDFNDEHDRLYSLGSSDETTI